MTERSARNKWIRVGVLLTVFAGLAGFAAKRMLRREQRSEWKRSVKVSVVLLSETPVSPAVVEAWHEGLRLLDVWFEAEAARLNAPLAMPLDFELVEPPKVGPLPVEKEGTLGAVELRRELARLAAGEGDVRLVVALGDAQKGLVEGVAEAGGDLGLVHATSKDTELGLELEAVAHETLHTLGALDSYGEDGRCVVPEGLAEPDLAPLYPQRFSEVMCGEISDGPGRGHVPRSIEEVRIGPATAAAIGWGGR